MGKRIDELEQFLLTVAEEEIKYLRSQDEDKICEDVICVQWKEYNIDDINSVFRPVHYDSVLRYIDECEYTKCIVIEDRKDNIFLVKKGEWIIYKDGKISVESNEEKTDEDVSEIGIKCLAARIDESDAKESRCKSCECYDSCIDIKLMNKIK